MSLSIPPWRGRAALAALIALPAAAQQRPDVLVAAHTPLERVSITGARGATLPIEIPTTLESITGAGIERSINASDAEDALKYFPSLLVRKRYIGDFDHAVLATRASGTGNSARSLVYVDGMLLSNLLGNGAAFAPRWGLVAPEEIERVDVLYGPFSAAYPGNSAGAIVDYVTRMPQAFEAHAKWSGFTQHHRLYATDDRFSGGQMSATLGDRRGAWSWWLNVDRQDSRAQPIGFATKTVPASPSASPADPAALDVTGALAGANPKGQPWLLWAATTRTHTLQDHAKLKLAWDLSRTLRLAYTLGAWRNDADRPARSFLRDAQGQPVVPSAGAIDVNIDGHRYSLTPADIAATRADQLHRLQGLDLRSHDGGEWDWAFGASRYDEVRDLVRTQAVKVGAAYVGAVTDQHGTGWTTLAAKATWRALPEHTIEGGVQRDAFELRTLTSTTGDWTAGEPLARLAAATGRTTLASVWAQDAWRFAPRWRSVLGLRVEEWHAFGGSLSNATATHAFDERRESHLSPKAALSYEAGPEWTLKASLGRAVRMPTVSELFQGAIVGSAAEVPAYDPALRPESSWTSELSAEREFAHGGLRATLFLERTRDALYAQFSNAAGVNTIQNVDAVRTSGVEFAWHADDVGLQGLDVGGSLTYADSKIARNDGFPASVGQRQPRVPMWRAALLASWHVDDRWSASLGARYSGRQYGQLDNSDGNDNAYTGFGRFFVADLRVRCRITRQWSAALGIDNLNNATYWAFHPYPQRTVSAELKFDL